MKTKGEIEDLKFLKVFKKRRKRKEEKTNIKKRMIVKIVKIHLGLSLVLWLLWGQFIFGQFLGPAYISRDLQAPSYVVGTNDRVLICRTCHFQGGSLCFIFCLLVSSVSDFFPDTKGVVVDTFFRLTYSVVLWGRRDAANKQHWRVLAVPQPHWACPCSWRVYPPCPHCSGSRLLLREPSEAGPGLHAPPRSKPLRFRHLGSPQRCRLGWACVLCPSQIRAAQVTRCLVCTVATTCCLPCPCRSVFWVYNRRTSGIC